MCFLALLGLALLGLDLRPWSCAQENRDAGSAKMTKKKRGGAAEYEDEDDDGSVGAAYNALCLPRAPS